MADLFLRFRFFVSTDRRTPSSNPNGTRVLNRRWCSQRVEDTKMGLARYDIVPIGKQWGVRHDGKINGEYSTKESAFESAATAASTAIHQGHEVHISVPSSENSGVASKAF